MWLSGRFAKSTRASSVAANDAAVHFKLRSHISSPVMLSLVLAAQFPAWLMFCPASESTTIHVQPSLTLLHALTLYHDASSWSTGTIALFEATGRTMSLT